jgi:ribosomal protein S18 acetylase RimI-like enzyme
MRRRRPEPVRTPNRPMDDFNRKPATQRSDDPSAAPAAPPVSRSSVSVRPGEPRDAEALAVLAAELNAHQGDPDDQFPPGVVLRDGFGETPKFQVLVAEYEGEVVGYAMLLPAYETGWGASGLYMSDLAVGGRWRRLGIGRRLMVACAAEVKRQGRGYLWWASRAWNEAAQTFYRNLGASDEPIFAHVLDAEGIERLAREACPGAE